MAASAGPGAKVDELASRLAAISPAAKPSVPATTPPGPRQAPAYDHDQPI